jgi:hypothetical protein
MMMVACGGGIGRSYPAVVVSAASEIVIVTLAQTTGRPLPAAGDRRESRRATTFAQVAAAAAVSKRTIDCNQ